MTGCALLALVGAAPRAEAVDLSGIYVVPSLSCQLTFTLTGTSLALTGTCADVVGTGSVDPATGTFSFYAKAGGCEYDASGSGDGETLSFTVTPRIPGCGLPPSQLTATKCGNRIVDPQENCDDGNSLGGDCCSERCRLDAALDACSDEGNPCTDDLCDGSGICIRVPNTSSCDDGRECTSDDVCANGTCRGTPLDAGHACSSDGNACTDDVCDGAGTCTHAGTPLHAGHACSSDGDACTDDICDGAGTCTHKPVENAPCDDGNACSSGDVCTNRICTPTGVAPVCQGTIDLTGTWILTPPVPVPLISYPFLVAGAPGTGGLLETVTFAQAGAVLTVPSPAPDSNPPLFLRTVSPGSINPASGQFAIGVFAAQPYTYGDIQLDITGTASVAGSSFDGNVSVHLPYSNEHADYAVSAWRQCGTSPCCGDGVLDPAETCDGPCCEPTCTAPLPAGTCASACAGTCDGTGTCVAGPCCGNGVVESGEACDGPCCDTSCSTPLAAGCSSACGGMCDAEGNCTPGPCCGNRVLETGEGCDGVCCDATCSGPLPAGTLSPRCASRCDGFGHCMCTGDCNGDETITINELVEGVNLALATVSLDACPSFDSDGDQRVSVNEIVAGVVGALDGCAR